jgi:hypothetical protein
MPRTKYEDLAVIPIVVADVTATRPYTGMEWSLQVRDSRLVGRVEALRRKMTDADRREFADVVEGICRRAYEDKRKWFMRIVRARGNAGRDRLYVLMSHWLAAFLLDPAGLRRRAGNPPLRDGSNDRPTTGR